MNEAMRVLGAVALCIASTGCDGAGDEESLATPSAWTYVGEFAYAPEGDELLTVPVALADAARGFALFAEVDGCAQVARLEDDTKTWVSALESGASCAACEERFSVIAGAGLLVHHPPEPHAGPARLRLGKIDCTTLTRVRPSADTPASRVRLWVRELPELPSEVEVPLRLHHGPFSSWAADADSQALLDEVSALLAPTGVRVVLDSSSFDDALPDSLSWFEGDPSALEPFVEPFDGVVDVVFAGCLEHVHPELGTHTVLDGLVPRIPAQAAPGAGIFLRGRACTAASLGPTVMPVEVQARVLAHELGHYLGLHHSVGTDGTLMAPDPSLVVNPVISPAQAERMRLHAALLSEAMPDR